MERIITAGEAIEDWRASVDREREALTAREAATERARETGTPLDAARAADARAEVVSAKVATARAAALARAALLEREQSERDPDALDCDRERLADDVEELDAKMEAMRQGLAALGVARADRIALATEAGQRLAARRGGSCPPPRGIPAPIPTREAAEYVAALREPDEPSPELVAQAAALARAADAAHVYAESVRLRDEQEKAERDAARAERDARHRRAVGADAAAAAEQRAAQRKAREADEELARASRSRVGG
ncbi:MAG TPA: hypothetical protein VK631_28980 [Solirubrobacteraceae bacterium]|nr:hypothetical protein [Solirubrobacteraceae bacterium]